MRLTKQAATNRTKKAWATRHKNQMRKVRGNEIMNKGKPKYEAYLRHPVLVGAAGGLGLSVLGNAPRAIRGEPAVHGMKSHAILTTLGATTGFISAHSPNGRVKLTREYRARRTSRS